MNVVVDTSIWIDFFKGKDIPELETALKECRVYTTPLIISELVSGTHLPSEENKLLEFLENLPLINFNIEHWIAVGRLRKKCQKNGYTVSTPDAHIAQATIDITGTLFSTDAIFPKIKKFINLNVAEF